MWRMSQSDRLIAIYGSNELTFADRPSYVQFTFIILESRISTCFTVAMP